MANYYNVCAWKHTGFDFKNRPFNREVLTQEYFTNPNNYIQMSGIAVRRDDTSGITYIDLPGSVKDVRGDQQNPPNTVGTHGPGGPWYAWEEVDYIRLTRTGYPGDEDFTDITGHVVDPWNAPGQQRALFIGYYFVTGLQPLARNVTRLFLSIDTWLTQGGASELTIESGFKIRGPVTDAEDAAGYNLGAESIGLIEPLEVKSHEILNLGSGGESVANNKFIVSSVDLLANSPDGSLEGFTVSTTDGQKFAIPAIKAAGDEGQLILMEPRATGSGKHFVLQGVNYYNPSNANVRFNLSVLQSAGQLELQDSYTIPSQYLDTVTDVAGLYTLIRNRSINVKPTIKKDVGSYPRKADYLYGQEVLYSVANGTSSIQNFADITDDSIDVWAVVSPTGSPYARFHGLRNHHYLYDQCIQGMTWMKKAVVLNGASGSMWGQIDAAFSLASANRSLALAEMQQRLNTSSWTYTGTGSIGQSFDVTREAIQAALGFGSNGGDRLPLIGGSPFSDALSITSRDVQKNADQLRVDAANQAVGQARVADARATSGQPYVNFVPEPSMSLFTDNGYGLYIVNTGSKDRERLKNYFRRYGYSGQYKKLTFDEINVKKRVNYVECEGVLLSHPHFPLRDTVRTAQLLESGCFFWNEKPNQAAFDDNADN